MENADVVVFIGEGNLSGAAAVMKMKLADGNARQPHFVACTLDPRSIWEQSRQAFLERGGTVIEKSVNLENWRDENYLRSLLPPSVQPLLNRRVHIVFNFPHTGVRNDKHADNVRSNQRLLRQLFNAGKTWAGGETTIAVTLKQTKEYHRWNLPEVAEQEGWTCIESSPFPFDALTNLGYRHKTTKKKSFAVNVQSAVTHVFEREWEDSSDETEFSEEW